MAVLARVHDFDACHQRAAALEVETLDGVGIHRLKHRPGHDALRRHVDELRCPRPYPAGVRDQRAGRGLRTRMPPHLGDADAKRCPIAGPLQGHRPAHGGDHEVIAEAVCARTVAAERRDSDVHDARVDLAHLVGVEVERCQGARPCRLEEEVRRTHE